MQKTEIITVTIFLMHNTITVTYRIVLMIQNLLYGDDNAAINNQLYDLDIAYSLILNDDKHTLTHNIYIHLSICDKLMQSDSINEILALNSEFTIPYTLLIINHTLSNDALISLYAKTGAYNLLHGCIHYNLLKPKYDNVLKYHHNVFRDATLNGLHVTTITTNDILINDDHVQYCTSLTTLNICGWDSKITTFAPFAKSLKVLYVKDRCIFCDQVLRSCTSIVELYAHNNRKITTCVPFANSLEVLGASGYCGIGDDGLVSCHSIKKLITCNNVKITTCEPFAKTLTILDAGNYCGITDISIESCHNIKKLYISNNFKITTCVPFAKSLTFLDASHSCGINDNGIATCIFLEYLYADYNPMITTCVPFARSLRYLTAGGVRCGITTKEILLCKSLIKLNVYDNNKIDCSKITMVVGKKCDIVHN